MGLTFEEKFPRETWTLYGFGILVILIRLITRFTKLGFHKLQADDYLMVNVIFWYTLLAVSINKMIAGGGSNYMTPEEEASLTPQTIKDREEGSKWVFVSEQAMVLTIWSLKLCMLFIYGRLTNGLKQKKFINALFVWVGVSFVGTQLCLFLACRPFPQYWAVPPSNPQCASYQYYEITECIFNTSSDILILLIGLPLLLSVRIPLQQKAILLLVFGMGIFVIVAAVITKIYCLVPSLISYTYLNWYFREASVSVYVTNLPALWTLIRDIFPALRSWGFGEKKSSHEASNRRAWGPISESKGRREKDLGHGFDMQNFGHSVHSRRESQEAINAGLGQPPLMIKQDITFAVEEGSLEGSEGGDVVGHGGETRCVHAA